MRSILIGMIALFAVSMTANAQEVSPTLRAIQSAGVLKVGMADSIPAQTKNPATGDWEGFNVDMAKNLAETLKVKLEIVDSTWSTLIPELMKGSFDIVMVDMFRTPARAETVVFTDSYMITGNTWLVRRDLNLSNWHQLNDPKYTIVTIAGTAAVAQSDKLLPLAKKKALVTENAVAPHLEVAAGRADAHLSDYVQNLLFIKANPNANVKILDPNDPIEAAGYSYAIRPGDYHFLAFLNTWIAYNTTTGFISERKQQWFGGK